MNPENAPAPQEDVPEPAMPKRAGGEYSRGAEAGTSAATITREQAFTLRAAVEQSIEGGRYSTFTLSEVTGWLEGIGIKVVADVPPPVPETKEGVEGDGQRSTDEIARDLREQKYLGIALSLVDEAADRLERLHRENEARADVLDSMSTRYAEKIQENAALRKTLIDVKHELRETSSWPYLTIDLRKRVTAALADGEKT